MASEAYKQEMPSDPFYRSKPWRSTRAKFLAAYPVCSALGCKQGATHVDHRISRRAGGADLEWSNLQGLCASCHSRKTAGRDGGFGNRRGGSGPIRARGCDVDGNPLAGWAR